MVRNKHGRSFGTPLPSMSASAGASNACGVNTALILGLIPIDCTNGSHVAGSDVVSNLERY